MFQFNHSNKFCQFRSVRISSSICLTPFCYCIFLFLPLYAFLYCIILFVPFLLLFPRSISPFFLLYPTIFTSICLSPSCYCILLFLPRYVTAFLLLQLSICTSIYLFSVPTYLPHLGSFILFAWNVFTKTKRVPEFITHSLTRSGQIGLCLKAIWRRKSWWRHFLYIYLDTCEGLFLLLFYSLS